MALEAVSSTESLACPIPEINQAALDTITLCGRIILAIVAKEGARVPSIAATHFNPISRRLLNPITVKTSRFDAARKAALRGSLFQAKRG